MEQSEKDIIFKYAIREYTKDDLHRLIPKYYGDDNLISRYSEVIKTRDSEGLQFLNMLPKNDVRKFELIDKDLLLSDWHTTHEDLVGVFHFIFNNNKESIDVLLKALRNIPQYLQHEDFKYPYVKKLIYAIGAQPEPYNIEALEQLAKSEDEKIRELSLCQVEKRKKFGRWETTKNAL